MSVEVDPQFVARHECLDRWDAFWRDMAEKGVTADGLAEMRKAAAAERENGQAYPDKYYGWLPLREKVKVDTRRHKLQMQRKEWHLAAFLREAQAENLACYGPLVKAWAPGERPKHEFFADITMGQNHASNQ